MTFGKPPERVLTVASITAPLLAAAGATDKIISRSFEPASFPGEYAPQLEDVPLLSTSDELGREVIISQNPDLVLTYDGAETSSPAELEPAGIDVLVPRGYCTDTARG